MKSIINKEHYKKLSKAEIKLVDAINEKPQVILSMNIATIAQEYGMSPSGLSRLARKLGYDKFMSLRVHLASEVGKMAKHISDANTGIVPDASDVFTIIEYSVRKTLSNPKIKIIIDFTKTISKQDRIVLFGKGSSYLAALELQNNMARLGLACVATNSHSMLLSLLSQQDTKFIIFSDSMNDTTINAALETIDPKRLLVLTQSAAYESPSTFHYEVMMITLKKNNLASKYVQNALADIIFIQAEKKFPYIELSKNLAGVAKDDKE